MFIVFNLSLSFSLSLSLLLCVHTHLMLLIKAPQIAQFSVNILHFKYLAVFVFGLQQMINELKRKAKKKKPQQQQQ